MPLQLPSAFPIASAIARDFRKLLAFGSGVGLEIGAKDLEVAVTRVRPNKIQIGRAHV